MRSAGHRAARGRSVAASAPFAAGLLLAALSAPPANAFVQVDAEAEVARALGDLRSTDAESRFLATVILGRHPAFAARSLPELASALADPQWPVRVGAARASEALLRHQTGQEASPALVQLLDDPSEHVRVAATYALAETSRAPAIARVKLLSGTRSDRAGVRVASWVALIRLFPKSARGAVAAAPGALALLHDALDREATWNDGEWGESCDSIAVRFARALSVMDPDLARAQVRDLVERFESGSGAASYALEAMAPQLARFESTWVSKLLLEDDGQREAILAVGLLGISNERAVGSLSQVLDGEGTLAGAAADSLGRLGQRAASAAAVLERVLLSSSDRELREAAGRALIYVDFNRVERVVARVRRTDPTFAEWLTAWAALSKL